MEDRFDLDNLERETRILIDTISGLTGESRSQVIQIAIAERYRRLTAPTSVSERRQAIVNKLQSSIWAHPPLGRQLSREEEDEILGYGPEGV